jgi:hypothetical protein
VVTRRIAEDVMHDSTDRAMAVEEMERLKQRRHTSLPRELLAFVLSTKKYWVLPILLVIGLLGVLAFLSSTPIAPFIYPLF